MVLPARPLGGVAGAVASVFVGHPFSGARLPPANLLFGVVELAGLLLLFFGPNNPAVVLVAVILFGLGMTGLVTSLGGLFAIDICPKRVARAALGLVGVFSYLGAAIQEQVSGALIDANMHMANGANVYDFGPVIWFWIGSSVLATLLATTLWNTKLRD